MTNPLISNDEDVRKADEEESAVGRSIRGRGEARRWSAVAACAVVAAALAASGGPAVAGQGGSTGATGSAGTPGAGPRCASDASCDRRPQLSSYTSTDTGDGRYSVPLLNADVPDISVERVPAAENDEGRDVYYMVSTTMHLSPGAPIMKSYDLVNWEIVSYVFDRASMDDAFSLRHGENSYGEGQWASSLRYHDGTFYVLFNTNNLGGAYLYSTDDVEGGTWERTALDRPLHDPSLFFDDENGGTPYIFYGSGAVSAVRLDEGMTRVVEEYPDIIEASDYEDEPYIGGLFEGAQVFEIDGTYYITVITWPPEGGRQVALFRAEELLGRYQTDDGRNPYEGKGVLDSNGFAQGSLVEIANEDGESDWYGMFFRDSFPVGRIPALVPATWSEGWPTFGDDGTVDVGGEFAKPIQLSDDEEYRARLTGVVASDDFANDAPRLPHLDEQWDVPEGVDPAEIEPNGSTLDPVWQWNHAPDNRYWSLEDRPGWLRLTNGSVVTGEAEYTKEPGRGLTYLEEARNTLSQRLFGPKASVETRLDVSGMRDGDVAGLAAYNRGFAYAAVKRVDGRNTLGVVERKEPFTEQVDAAEVEEFVPGSTVDIGEAEDVYLKLDADTGSTPGQLWTTFSYSLDGRTWEPLGERTGPQTLDGSLSHFMGHRFGLFNYATQSSGGHVDVDYYYLSDVLTADGAELDRSALTAGIAWAQRLSADDYTAASWAEVEKALAWAEATTRPSTQNQIDAPAHALARALASLES